MTKLPIVISASRMTDMPAFYPESIIREVDLRRNKGLIIHTIVLWTKHVASLFREPLQQFLKEQQNLGTQIYVQLTLTGIGRECYVSGIDKKVYPEPCVPSLNESLKYITRLIELTGSPERIRLRVDPLLRLKDFEGNIFSNFEKLPEIIEILQPQGIRNFSFSFLEKDVYKKVDNRFLRNGIQILPPDEKERLEFAQRINYLAIKSGVIVSACSVPSLKQSACIDGSLLQQLHNEHWPLDLKMPRSRNLCGCTSSIDIGGWPPKTCNSGCIYCYSRPKI